ncbi:DUF4157 domain-containing protein [Longispora sp. NPDC051575]|uniref:eCIS core domain-containing protein n=1 Tax=Longispora sp. NPDC051575 TaxID=3154943 RepID=UPI00342E93AB
MRELESTRAEPTRPTVPRASAAPRPLLALQRLAGNAAVNQLLRPGPAPAARPAPHPDRTGLPGALRADVEARSGLPLDDVRVHAGSDLPALHGAKAFTEGTDIHLSPGAEDALGHELWHVVQQKQGRVPAEPDPDTEAALEEEADRGAPRAPALAAPGRVRQFLKVKGSDVGKSYRVKGYGKTACVLTTVAGGGWYHFETPAGKTFKVKGHVNILKEVAAAVAKPLVLDDTETEFTVDTIAKTEKRPRKEVYGAIRRSFQNSPRTLRVHTPFGTKTVSKGSYEAFTDPLETTKAPQAMVSYRTGDYGHGGKKIGGTYKSWATELSDDERDDRAGDMNTHLDSVSTAPGPYYTERQKAAAAALLITTQVSEPLRTETSSDRAAVRGQSGLKTIALSGSHFGAVFGEPTSAEYFPAQASGSAKERAYYRGEVTDPTVPDTYT